MGSVNRIVNLTPTSVGRLEKPTSRRFSFRSSLSYVGLAKLRKVSQALLCKKPSRSLAFKPRSAYVFVCPPPPATKSMLFSVFSVGANRISENVCWLSSCPPLTDLDCLYSIKYFIFHPKLPDNHHIQTFCTDPFTSFYHLSNFLII